MTTITATQGRYLAYIKAYSDGFGFPPAESEIAGALGVSPPSAHLMMKTLERKGFIRRFPGTPRSTEILVAQELIPKWKGKRIVRVVTEWTLARPKERKPESRAEGKRTIVYRFKIILKDSIPAIWRRIETKDVTLSRLHGLIQAAMGWTDSHLYVFEIAGEKYFDPRYVHCELDEDSEDSQCVRISQLVAHFGKKLRLKYEYDFGDSWIHSILLESVSESESGVLYPRCTGGERACPPEDIGGVGGFARFLSAMSDPSDPEHESYLEWNGPYDPEKFSSSRATNAMKKTRRQY